MNRHLTTSMGVVVLLAAQYVPSLVHADEKKSTKARAAKAEIAAVSTVRLDALGCLVARPARDRCSFLLRTLQRKPRYNYVEAAEKQTASRPHAHHRTEASRA